MSTKFMNMNAMYVLSIGIAGHVASTINDQTPFPASLQFVSHHRAIKTRPYN